MKTDGVPAVRPFGAVIEDEGVLYITTGAGKDVYRQLQTNPMIELAVTKAGTHDWLRVSGKAEECTDVGKKQKMLTAYPSLAKRYGGVENSAFTIFAIREMRALHYTEAGVEEL